MGYLSMEENTRNTLDEEGWLHSGDLGNIDDDGFLTITGRIKGGPKQQCALLVKAGKLDGSRDSNSASMYDS